MAILCLTFMLAVTAIVSRAETPLPSFLQLCSRDDAQLGQCIIDSVMSLRDKLKSGIPEMKIPSIEPLLLGDMVLETSEINMTSVGVTAQGVGDFQLSDMSMDKKGAVTFRVSIPKLTIKSKYSLEGSIMMVPVTGTGTFAGEMHDTVIDVSIVLKFEKNLVLDSMKLKSKIGNGKIDIQDSKSPDISKAINEAANDNIQETLAEFLPIIENTISKKITAIVGDVFQTFTYDQLLPMKSGS